MWEQGSSLVHITGCSDRVNERLILVHKKQFERVYAVQEVACEFFLFFTWCSAAVKQLEVARKAKTGRVVVMKGHVFIKNCLRGAMQ